jgi:hypothetical protein
VTHDMAQLREATDNLDRHIWWSTAPTWSAAWRP